MDHEVSCDEIKARFKLTDHLESIGVRLGSGSRPTTNVCPRKRHKKDHQCVTIFVDTQTFHCNDPDCQSGGSIIDWLAVEKGVSDSQIIKDLSEEIRPSGNGNGNGASKKKPKPNGPKREVCHYDYQDEQGEPLFRVIRFEPKTFEQWRANGHGGFTPGMSGISRVLYRLPEIIASETVIVCEGEKDADNLSSIGFVATTSCGGAKGWLPAYAEFLIGKHIIIMPDKDGPGREYAEAINKSVQDKVLSIKIVLVPDPFKDASEYIESFDLPFEANEPLQRLIDQTPHCLKPIPILSMQEMEARYIQSLQADESKSFDLGRFLPSLGGSVRKLIPGELMCIMAATGVGKTALMQGIARAASPLPTLFFQLELPAELMFERFIQMERQETGDSIEQLYKNDPSPRWQSYTDLSHIYVCPESGLTVETIEELIHRSQLKIGVEPVVVFVDYIGLVRNDKGRSRYETVSNAAEQLKVIAKRTKTIIIMGTQVSRPYKDGPKRETQNGDGKKDPNRVNLHDGKDSGSIENSAGLVLGAWRTDGWTLKVRVLKNTKGVSGREVTCNFDGAKMRITERSQIDPEDVPHTNVSPEPNGHEAPETDPEPQQWMAYPDPE